MRKTEYECEHALVCLDVAAKSHGTFECDACDGSRPLTVANPILKGKRGPKPKETGELKKLPDSKRSRIYIDFTGYEDLLDYYQAKAEEEFRSFNMEILFILNHHRKVKEK